MIVKIPVTIEIKLKLPQRTGNKHSLPDENKGNSGTLGWI
jgi:hypothetical protein